MSLGEFTWYIFLGGLPFAPLLERRLDLWHGQALWADLWIGILFGLSIFTGQKKSTLGNKPLAAWLLLTWVWVLWTFTQGIIANKQYNLQLFMPMLHILSIGLFYMAAKVFWTRSFIERLLKILAVSGGILVAYGLCQALNFDPIFKDLDTSVKTHEIVGLIGNPSHFSIYLAIILPIFWVFKNKASTIAQAGIWSLLAIILVRNASVTGILAAIAASLTWWMFKNKHVAVLIGVLTISVIGFLLIRQSHFHQILTDSGRFKAWETFSKLIGNSPMWGIGPGAISFISNGFKGAIAQWRHCHNEFLQITIEQGLAGLALVCWFIYDTYKRIVVIRQDVLTPALAAICVAFLVSSMNMYPAHLWMLGAIGLFAICAINVLSETEC